MLPDYETPPVVETVLGVQFALLSGFTNAHLGAFWKTLDGAEWPTVSDAPPLDPQFERFTETGLWESVGVKLRLTQDPAFRLQIKNCVGDRMIQVQNGRLHLNWLGLEGGEYPRYASIQAEFAVIVSQFIDFLAKEGLEGIQPNQWEITYVNHIDKGTVWSSTDDWTFCRLLGALSAIETVVAGESFGGEWHFVIPERRGRLHVHWQHVVKASVGESDRQTIRLTFTARGPIETHNGTIPGVFKGLDLGHETIVKSFQRFMTDDANRHWRLRDGS